MRLSLLAIAAVGLVACGKPAGGGAGVVGDAALGRDLYVQKGCVLCHAVNGVGGKAAPPLDAAPGKTAGDPLEFSARMWRGAPAMVELQSLELGYVIELSAKEIADLAAFAGNADEQKKLDAASIPEPMRDSLLDERFWETEDWSEFLKSGQEDYDPAAPPAADQEPAAAPN